MPKTKPVAIFLVLSCSVLGAGAQILLKMGSNVLIGRGTHEIMSNYWLFGGYVCYAISTLLLIVALKNGELSVLYPIIATTYVWVIFLSPLFFPSDTISLMKIVGVLCIVLGVTVIGLGATK